MIPHDPKNALFPLLITALFILMTTMFTKAQDVFTFGQLGIGLVLTIFILAISIGLALAFSISRERRELDDVMVQLKELVPRTGFPWLYKDVDLAKAESKARGDNIWIVSPDLSNVTEKRVITDAVKKNVKRGITYTYIVPDIDDIDGVLPALEQVFGSHPERLKLLRVQRDQFRLLAVSHIAVFNATISSSMSDMEVYIELPIQEDEGKKVHGYWIRVEREAARRVAGRFRKLVADYKDKK